MKFINLVDQRFGRLLVIKRIENDIRGKLRWLCKCDCGNLHEVASGNLKGGMVKSCGCLHRELSAERAKITFTKPPPPPCSIEGCGGLAEEFDRTLCQKHAARVRRYGDPLYVTPEDKRRANSRIAQLKNVVTVKSTTYRKLFGRHEHRVIGEKKVGRPLRSDEHVHHNDENRHNNDPSNLIVMTRKEHLSLHAQKRRNKNA